MDYVIMTIILVGSCHSFVLAILLWFSKNGNRRANRFLALLLVTYAIDLFISQYLTRGWFDFYPHYFRFPFPFIFMYGPLLLLYLNAYTNPGFRFGKRSLIHFIPFLALAIWGIPFFFGNAAAKIAFFQKLSTNLSLEFLFITLAAIIHAYGYDAIMLGMIKRHHVMLKKSFSNLSRLNLSWMSHLIMVNLVVWSLVLFLLVSAYRQLISFKLMINIIYLCVALKVFVMGYRGLMQPEVFGYGVEETARKIGKPTLSPGYANDFLIRLKKLMHVQKLFLEPELTLQQMAEKVSLPAYQLSHVINEGLQQNFFQFINQYRVDEAKTRLQSSDYSGDKLIKIAFDSGFNSLATFNRVFKSMTGMTPSAYRRNPTELTG